MEPEHALVEGGSAATSADDWLGDKSVTKS